MDSGYRICLPRPGVTIFSGVLCDSSIFMNSCICCAFLRVRQTCQMAKTRIVNGMVITGNSHQLGPTERETRPSGEVEVSKKTMLKSAETKVPGRKAIVTAAMLSEDSSSAKVSEEVGIDERDHRRTIFLRLRCNLARKIRDL